VNLKFYFHNSFASVYPRGVASVLPALKLACLTLASLFFFVCVLFFDECVFAPWAHDDTMNYLDIAFGNGSRLRLKTLLPCGPICNNLERIGHISVGCHLFR
jgi:hypothetical protein